MNILGIMSGTSLDGLDLTICSFWESGQKWIYRLHAAETIPYPGEWSRKLQAASHLSGIDLLNLHQDYGQWIADNATRFIGSSGLKVDLIASHGHTVFHQPEAGFTMQAGDPQVIATSTGITTAGDFRRMDVLLGGQGAPLVPVGLGLGRVGNFIGGELWGRLSDVPWAMIFAKATGFRPGEDAALVEAWQSGALDHLDDVVALIRQSKSPPEAKEHGDCPILAIDYSGLH